MALVEHLDIYPTLADIAAIDIPAATMGRSMVGGNARRLERRDILRSTAHTEHGAHGTPNTDARMHRAHGARSTVPVSARLLWYIPMMLTVHADISPGTPR